ncbi:MAG: dihydrodipicolinate synthase family protein [Victivallales bacterium]|nr:dihydrodipicolinate synthase family protein [Victivallales bacterium]
MIRKFTGIMPALLTPYDEEGNILKKSVFALVDRLIAQGADGFYIVGATGEGVVLSLKQRITMVEYTMEAIHGRVKAIVHTGSINPDEAVELTRHAEQAGADAVSAVPPSYYFKYNNAETVEYYKRLAGATSLPFLMYATPALSTEGVNDIINELIKVENFIGLKDTRANYFEMWKLREQHGDSINIINGPDETLLCGLTMGADAGIGTTYNLMQDLFGALYKAFLAKDIILAQRYQTKINRVIKTLLDNNALRACKEYLTAKGIDMGITRFPRARRSQDEINAMVRTIDTQLALPL